MGDQNHTGRGSRSVRALAAAALVLGMHAFVASVFADELIVGDATSDPDDPASAQSVQRSVDSGDQPWRLDPLEVARADTAVFGINPDDPMQVVQEDAGAARVRAQHAGKVYEIGLTQPERPGPTGIWVVTSVNAI